MSELVTTKSPHDMTIQELQAEIGKLQSILHYKVCGDPAKGVGMFWKLSDEAKKDIKMIEQHLVRF